MSNREKIEALLPTLGPTEIDRVIAGGWTPETLAAAQVKAAGLMALALALK